MPLQTDPARIPHYIAASTLVLGLVIGLVHKGGNRRPVWIKAFAVAGAISLIGIGFAKFGANWGLPWWIYYTVPMLATVLVPPMLFAMGWRRGLAYVLLAFLTAPLIHAAFFYGLGWGDYMPFLTLPG